MRVDVNVLVSFLFIRLVEFDEIDDVLAAEDGFWFDIPLETKCE